MILKEDILNVILEDSILKTTKSKPIADAIKNRKKISFMYYGPQSPKKDSVKQGKRIKVEPVAIGLSKKGNLVIRAWVDPPSVSKKGFDKTHWRTYMVGRMRDIQVHDETFDSKRPDYVEGNDGSMSITYVTSDWAKKPETKKITKPTPSKPTPSKPEVKKTELPQPKPTTKPSRTPLTKTTDYSKDLMDKLSNKIQTVDDKKFLSQKEFNDAKKELYDLKQKDWSNSQKEVGGNTSPGQGTRSRFDRESDSELRDLLRKDNIEIVDNPPQEPNNLQESIKRIKTLMFR